jgi:TonB family protein
MFFTATDTRYRRAGSGLCSLAIHTGAALLLFTASSNQQVRDTAHRTVTLLAPLIAPYIPGAKPLPRQGGGGGGGRSPLPASEGMLPRAAPRQFTPPMAVVENAAPKLVLEATLVMPPDAGVPNVQMSVWGDPLGKIGPPSNGPGSGGGIGTGDGSGVGPGRGPGFGPGEGGGVTTGSRRGAITGPAVLRKVEPEYSDEARKSRLQGQVEVVVDIGVDGRAHNPRLRSTLGMGLDERAIEAVLKWRFRPAFQDGAPVASSALILVNFRLL